MSTFLEHSKEVTKRFLQTAVVVDDQAAFNLSSHASPAVGKVNVPGYEHIRENKAEDKNFTGKSHKLDAKVLSDAFAKFGIVCAILKPSEEEIVQANELGRRTISVANLSDILVLDWELNDDRGDTVRAIIKDIAENQEKDGRLRLIAIYTATPDIAGIQTKLIEDLEAYSIRQSDDDTQLLLSGERLRIVIYAKPGTNVNSAYKDLVLDFDKLPQFLVRDFSSMTYGLVSNLALASLAAIRENSHRLLYNLHRNLDAPYLAHRCMLPQPEDAGAHLVDVIGGELHSILNDAEIINEVSLRNIKLWLKDAQKAINFHQKFQGNNHQITISHVSKLLEVGCEAKYPKVFPTFGDKPQKKISAKCFHDDEDEAALLDQELAVRMTVKAQYTRPAPVLSLGHILWTTKSKEISYWLCMQPVCDSLRIDGVRAFPLLSLKPVSKGNKFDIIVKDENDQYLELILEKQIHTYHMVKFSAHPQKRCVVARKDRSRLYFPSNEKVRYYWLGQLKMEYAYDMADKLATQISRIGLNTPEWMRRLNK